MHQLRELVEINWKLIVGITALVAVVSGLLATGELRIGHSDSSPRTTDGAYGLGYSCAQAAWQVAGNASANAGEYNLSAMGAVCAKEAKSVGVSNAASSPFHKGFTDGIAAGPTAVGGAAAQP
jgi:hypothetical protein